ncbi:MAG: Gfo/Idh/MocA family protein [Phycisphaerae bacterium]
MGKVWKGGVFGFGGVGQGMTQQINIHKWHGDDVRIVAAANRGKEKRDLAAREYNLAAYETIDQLLAHGVDFVLIVSTSQAHREAAVKCARAGVPFLIEKPIALTLQDAQEIVDETEKAGVINGVNYSMRYMPLYIKMKQLVDAGEVGRIIGIWGRVGRGHGLYSAGKRHRAIAEPKESGGWIIHHMCHITDWAIWLAGPVDEVYTLTNSTAPAELDSEETIFSTVKFKSGAIGTLADTVAFPRDHASGVTGTRGGMAEVNEGVKPLIKLFYETDREWRPPHVIDPEEGIEREDGLKHFLRCLKAGKPTNVPVREAWYSLKVCHAMRRSAHEGRPVRID